MDVERKKQKSLLRQKCLTKMLLGEAVMLFHRKIRCSKKYRALTDTDPLVAHNQCGFFHACSNGLILGIFIAHNQCGFFHVCSNGLILSIFIAHNQ